MITFDVKVTFEYEDNFEDDFFIEHWEVDAKTSEEANDLASDRAEKECEDFGYLGYYVSVVGC